MNKQNDNKLGTLINNVMVKRLKKLGQPWLLSAQMCLTHP